MPFIVCALSCTCTGTGTPTHGKPMTLTICFARRNSPDRYAALPSAPLPHVPRSLVPCADLVAFKPEKPRPPDPSAPSFGRHIDMHYKVHGDVLHYMTLHILFLFIFISTSFFLSFFLSVCTAPTMQTSIHRLCTAPCPNSMLPHLCIYARPKSPSVSPITQNPEPMSISPCPPYVECINLPRPPQKRPNNPCSNQHLA